MSKKISDVDLNHITDIVYLDIINKKNNDLEKIYDLNFDNISLEHVLSYYLAKGEFQVGPGLQELRDRFGGNYDEVRQLLEKMYDSTNPDYKQWKISNIVSNNKADQSGFVAYTIEPEPNVAIIAFRGSEPLSKGNFNDWLNNFLTSYMLESPQQKEAREYIERIAKRQGIKELYLTGHSLGGNLANYASFNLPPKLRDKLVSCSTWGAPGFNPEVLRKYATVIKELNINKKYQRFCNPFDPTPSLFYQPTSSIFLESNNPDGGILYNHSSFSLEETVDSYGNPIHQRSTVQVPSTLSLIVNKLSLSLEALPAPLKASLVHIIFSVWNGRLDYKDVMYVALALRNIPILIGGLKLVATLIVLNMIVNELIPKQEVSIDSNNDAIQKELKEILEREKLDLISLLNRVVASGIGLGLALDNFKKEAFSKVQAFFSRISKVIASNLSSKWDKGQTVSSFVKRPAPSHSLHGSTQLSVDLNRLKDLQRKMGSLERDFEESVEEILRDTKRMSSDVAREYPEFNVQQQIHEINRKLDQIRDCNRQVCNQMQSKVKGLRSAIDTYRVTELRLLREVWY